MKEKRKAPLPPQKNKKHNQKNKQKPKEHLCQTFFPARAPVYESCPGHHMAKLKVEMGPNFTCALRIPRLNEGLRMRISVAVTDLPSPVTNFSLPYISRYRNLWGSLSC